MNYSKMKYIKLYETNDDYYEWKGILQLKYVVRKLREELFFEIEKAGGSAISGDSYDLVSTLNGVIVNITVVDGNSSYYLHILGLPYIYNTEELIISLVKKFGYRATVLDKILDKSPYMFEILENMLPDKIKAKYAYLKNELF